MQINTAKKMYAYRTPIKDQIKELQSKIKSDPKKVELRIHLAQLLMVIGQWQKATQQLQTIALIDNKTSAMAKTYCMLIQAEVHREQVFNAQRDPEYFIKPDDWQLLLAEAIVARTHQQNVAAVKFQQQAYVDAPTVCFSVNKESVNWVADGDSRLGPIFEAFINGSYYWLPFNKIQSINIEAPNDLRDLVWVPAIITLVDHSIHYGFIPSRYAFSYTTNNDQLALANLTEWESQGDEYWVGIGQKMLITDQIEYPLLSIRTMTQLKSE